MRNASQRNCIDPTGGQCLFSRWKLTSVVVEAFSQCLQKILRGLSPESFIAPTVIGLLESVGVKGITLDHIRRSQTTTSSVAQSSCNAHRELSWSEAKRINLLEVDAQRSAWIKAWLDTCRWQNVYNWNCDTNVYYNTVDRYGTCRAECYRDGLCTAEFFRGNCFRKPIPRQTTPRSGAGMWGNDNRSRRTVAMRRMLLRQLIHAVIGIELFCVPVLGARSAWCLRIVCPAG